MVNQSKITKDKSDQKEVIVENGDDSLIPSHILDQASQRIFVTSFFVLIQCWKIYDMLVLKTNLKVSDVSEVSRFNTLGFFLKYAMLDGLFLWFLPILNIQLLTFSPIKTFIYTVILNLTTFFLVTDAAYPLLANVIIPLGRVVFRKKELTIIGETVNVDNVLDPNTRFKGKVTINYLPYSSVKFNPFNYEKLCIDPYSSNSIRMPIEFNVSSELGSLSIQHTTLENKEKYITYSYSELKNLLRKDYKHLEKFRSPARKDDSIFYIEVPLSEPGLYRISSASDIKGISIRSYKSDFMISYCPTSSFSYSIGESAPILHSHICTNDHKSSMLERGFPEIQAFGVFPLDISIDAYFEGEFFKTFNIYLENPSSIKKELKKLDAYRCNFAKKSLVSDLLPQTPKTPGTLEYRLNEIRDATGNVQKYNPKSKDSEIYFQIKVKKNVYLEFQKSSPSYHLEGENSSLPLRIASDMKLVDFPITVNFEYVKSNTSYSEFIEKTFKGPDDIKKGISINGSGTISIIGASGRYCSCVIGDNKTNQLHVSRKPSVQILANSIVDKCVGMTGYDFQFNFEGTPPFVLSYQVYQNNSGILKPVYNDRGSIARSLKSLDWNLNFEFKPPKEGSYTVIFDKLKDFNYNKSPVIINKEEHTYSTHFSKRSRLGIFRDSKYSSGLINVCFGSMPKFNLNFEGNLPYNVSYTLVESDSRKAIQAPVELYDVNEESREISIPPLKKGGIYEVILDKATDGIGCPVDFGSHNVARINVRNAIPKIGIDISKSKEDVKIIEGGSFKIPLIMEYLFKDAKTNELGYSFAPLDNPRSKQFKTLKNLEALRVKEEGTYRLEYFSVDDCPGEILRKERYVNVSFYEKPLLKVHANASDILEPLGQSNHRLHLKPDCFGTAKYLYLHFEGKAPFIVEYEIELPSGKFEEHSIKVNSNFARLKLSTAEGGNFVYKFKKIYDKIYTRSNSEGIGRMNKMPYISYQVFDLPSAKFEGRTKIIQTCETNLKHFNDALDEVPITYKGQFPFNLNLSLTSMNDGKSFIFALGELMAPTINLNEVVVENMKLKDLLQVGDYALHINGISDANGCSNLLFDQNSILISVTEIPTIKKARSKFHYCVGDHVTYNITGLAPFKITYKFNDLVQIAESQQMFSRFASKSGNLSILALEDSTSKSCYVDFSNFPEEQEKLDLIVHDLPSVEINQGDYLIEDIYEGDQVEIKFTFTGVPPFRLIYTRTFDASNESAHRKQIKSVETNIIEDVWDTEYTIVAKLEGTYEAIEVEDAYCKAIKRS